MNHGKTEVMPFHRCGMVDGQLKHFFCVPAGVNRLDALEESSSILCSMAEMITDAGLGNLKIEGNYAWLLSTALESAKALVDAVTAGMLEEEAQAALQRPLDNDKSRESNVITEFVMDDRAVPVC